MSFKKIAEEIRKAALAYPGAYEESPWGERAFKVKGKIFIFAGRGDKTFGVSVKLPSSSGLALTFPFARPTPYGLGKSGWITASFQPGEDVPTGLILEWMDESYRAIAPKTLVKELDGAAPAKAAKAPKKKRATKKGTILVVSDDELRGERARKAIDAEGLGKATCVGVDEAFEKAARAKPGALVVDLGRRPEDALEVGIQLAHAHGKAKLIFAGARDAATVKKARAAADNVRGAFRAPPGDPDVIAELASALG